MAVEISGVTLCPGDDLITGAYLDYPRTGPVDGYAFEVFGWVVGKAPVAEVEFVHDGSVVACCELTVSRPDVARKYGSSSSQVGFWKAIGTVGLPPDFTIRVRVVFQDGRRARDRANMRQAAANLGVHPLHAANHGTHPGRSGSTRLMRMLVESIQGCPPWTENPMSADSVCQPPVAGTKRIFAAVTSMKENDWTGKTAGGVPPANPLPTLQAIIQESRQS